QKIISEQVSIIVGHNYLMSFQEEKGDVFGAIRNRIKSGDWIRKKNHDYLAYTILDAILDNYFVVLDYMEEIIDELEVKLIKTSDHKDLEAIIDLKNQTIVLKKAIAPIRDLVIKLQHLESRISHLNLMKYYLSDLQDHAVIIHENMENISLRVLNLFSIYHSSINNSMNERMKVLTIVSTIFVPLTFLAGLYGMNFKNMPELEWTHGYYFVVGIMWLIGVGMLYFFKRKRWI
ncbi:MAG: magnesium/cobalt transporter CorA, partial [Fusobacteriaceae bacterium]